MKKSNSTRMKTGKRRPLIFSELERRPFTTKYKGHTFFFVHNFDNYDIRFIISPMPRAPIKSAELVGNDDDDDDDDE